MAFFNRLRARSPDGTLAIAVVAALLVAGIWFFTLERGRSEQREAAAAEFSKNANLALALDVHTNQLLSGIDEFLLLMQDQYQGPASHAPIPLARLVAPALAGKPSVAFVGVTNERGDIVDSLQPFQPTNVADRDFFQRQQRGEVPGMLISEPALGRVSGVWAISLTRRIVKTDGSFGGIVGISIEPQYLTELFETTNLGPNDMMSLVLTNGVTLARRRGTLLEFGENIAGSRLMAEYTQQPIGGFTGPGGVDGQVRMFSYRGMTDYPVVATVGTLEADVLAPVRRRAQRSALAAGAATLFVVFVSVASFVMLDRQQRANRRLHEQASLLDKAQDAIIVTDLDRRITYWNKSAERLYGWTAAEAVGRVVTELFHDGAGADEAGRAYNTVLRRGEWTGELRPVNKLGRPVIVESRFTLVRDAQGDPQSILSINTDVSERRQLEQQFYRAQRLESIGTLAGGIAHDLNNVLAPIMMAIELLKESVTAPADREVLAMMDASTSRGAEMVRQVLAYARGVEGRRVEIDPGTLVADVARIARDTLPKTIDLQTRVESGLPPLVGDPTQCHQVLVNLCVNARDAMPAGGQLTMSAALVRLDDSSGVNLPPGTYVKLEVRDTGTGIAADIADKIFDPFFTTKEPGQGTGLGLSTSLAIVKSHGGDIQVASHGGRGAVFEVYLPAGAGAGANPGPVAVDVTTGPEGGGQTVLVVDDEAGIRMIAQRTLERGGYRVLLAADGAEAVAVFGVHHQTLAAVLLDMTMPVLAGVPAIQAMARINPRVPIVAMSGIIANEEAARAASEQVKVFLPKPFTTKTLLAALNHVLA
ncbi:MAG: PAS domain S-box protein [Acidobacteriota bacterium]|nr:PAS domain S-box protein [Acidobacteriota bacterium]